MARKIFLEEGWTQKRQLDVGWSDVSQCQPCQIEEGTEKHRLYEREYDASKREACGSKHESVVGVKGENVDERMEMAKRKRPTHTQ